MIFMGAPLLAYVQNIVQEMRVCVSSRMAMRGGAMAAACHGLMYVAPSFVHSRIAGMAAGT